MVSVTPRIGFSAKAGRTRAQPISALMQQAVTTPGLISLAAGLVDRESLPCETVRAAIEELMLDAARGQAALQYGTTQGDPRLRNLLTRHLGRLEGIDPHELSLGPDQVVVTSGSQQLLYLASDLVLDPGDIVLVPWPTYFVYLGVLESLGARAIGVPMDDGGLRTDALREQLDRLRADGLLDRVKLIYLASYYQNPTGLTLAVDRRAELVRIAQQYSDRHRILIIEDAAYRELCYEGTPPPSVKRFDPTNQWVVLTQTFSKPFAPGMRTGYGFLPDELVEPLERQKGNHDFGSANFNQHLLAEAMESDLYAEHTAELVARYRHKLGVMLEALDEEFGRYRPEVDWIRPTGGLYVWMTMPADVDTGPDGALLECALARGVSYVPGAYCYPPEGPCGRPPRHALRLCFGVVGADRAAEGIRRLARAFEDKRSGRAG